MKYLIFILVSYAVKCEDVGNYFVVEMPDNPHHDIKDFKKPFQVYWNVPTMQCASKKIPFQNLYEKFGIIQNNNDRFIGDKIVIIYNEVDFPAIIYNKTSGEKIQRNGGVPQEGNLKKHLIAFEKELKDRIPDPYFDGIGIIDFESWRPVFLQNFGNLVPHRHLSIEIEKQLHNWWPKMWIEREAALRFEAAARRFMQTTLSMAKEMRPNALWGYYGFPHCFNMRGRDMSEKCAKNVDKENDSIYWLWAESTALFPSLYSSVSLSSSQLSSLIKGRVKETSRVRGTDTPIFPYFWFRYRDLENGFMTEKDLKTLLTTLYESKASGFIIWGSSNDVNTVEKCNKLHNYVETVLGPNISKFTKQIKRNHSDKLENGEILSKESSVYDGKNTHTLDEVSLANYYTNADKSSEATKNYEYYSTDSFITYNDYTSTEESPTLNNEDLFLSIEETSTIYSEYMNSNKSIQTQINDEISPTETSVTYNNDIGIDKNSQTLNKDVNNSSSSETSTPYSEYTNTVQSTQTVNNDEIYSEKIETTYNSFKGKSFQNFNNVINNEETLIIYNEYFDTDENVQTLNNKDIISSSESTYDKYTDSDATTTVNNDEKSEYIKTVQSKEIADNIIISSEGTSTICDNFVNDDRSTESLDNVIYLKETSPASDYVSDTRTTLLIGAAEITKNDEIKLTEDNFPNNNKLLNSSEDRFDYLIKVDNSTNIENFNQSEYIDGTNVDNDYLIIVKNFNNKINSIQNITGDKLEADYITEIDNNHKIELKSKNFSKTSNELDLVVTYIKNNKKQDLISTEDESLLNVKFQNSDEDTSDYLVIVDNSTNIETYQESEHPNITNDDNDYLILVRDLNNSINIKDRLDATKIEADFVTESKLKDFNETVENFDQIETLQDLMSSEDEYFNSDNNIGSDEDGTDYLIKVNSTYKESEDQQNEDSINDDNDYLIILKKFNDEQDISDDILYNKLAEFPSTTEIVANFTEDTESYDFNKTTENFDEDIFIASN